MNNTNSNTNPVTTTLDLSTMLKRLSVLQNIPIRKTDADYDDTEDEEEDDEEEDEEDEELDKKSEDSNRDEATIKINTEHCNNQNLFVETINKIEEAVEETFKPNKIVNKYKKLNYFSFETIQEVCDQTENDKNKQPDQIEKQFNEEDEKPTEHDQQNVIAPLVKLNNFEPISIDTNFSNSSNGYFSPKDQILELEQKLQKEIREKYKITAEKKIYEDQINRLLDENARLKNDLQNLKKPDGATQLSECRLKQIEALKAENAELQSKNTEMQNKNAEYLKQIEKLKKYEALVNESIYQELQKIGRGGFSEVFECLSLKDSKTYALKKVNLRDLDEQNTALVMNEIELLKKLQSTSKVIKLIEHSKKMLYLVMEIGSMDLNVFFKTEIHKHGCVREPIRVYYWLKMLQAVQAVHKLGVIHSDLKPSNFLVVGCEVKLIDFNISNSISDRTSITMTSDCGTLNYMAPESITKDSNYKTKINQKVDVWSLGVILYLMTYGKLPFQHLTNQYQLIFTLTDPKKEIKFGPIGDHNLKDTLSKCFCHEPSDRFSVDQLLSHPYITSKS